jgi:uncharacterized protein
MSENSANTSRNRFEFGEDGATAYIEFEVDNLGWMTIWHTEVPPSLRGHGIADMLARTALEYARDNGLKVDVICPFTSGFIQKNPEFKALVGK